MEDDVKKEAEAKKLFSKLQARDRLTRLADVVRPRTVAERELERMREYISQWARWMHERKPGLEMPHAASFSEAGQSWIDLVLDPLGAPNLWAINLVDASIRQLCEREGGSRLRSALVVRWLNEKVDATVFRSMRIPPGQLDDLADAAERALIEIVKRNGMPL